MSKAAGIGKTSRKKEFYVYALLDPTKPGNFQYGRWKFHHEPFYVGKGKNARASQHNSTERANPFKARKISKIENQGLSPLVCLKRKQLTEKQALSLEVALIARIGRRDKKLGPLTNLTDGGDGLVNPSQTTRRKIGLASIGRKSFLGKNHTEETKRLIGLASLGRIKTEQSKRRLSVANSGANNPFFGRTHTKATKLSISTSKLGQPSGFIGKHHSKESKQKLSERLSKRCVADNKKYPSLDAAAVACNVSPTTIRNRINWEWPGYRYY